MMQVRSLRLKDFVGIFLDYAQETLFLHADILFVHEVPTLICS